MEPMAGPTSPAQSANYVLWGKLRVVTTVFLAVSLLSDLSVNRTR